jgi:hypothetical protein
MVRRCWDIECPHSDPIDRWQFNMRNLRKKIKGWIINVDAELKKMKEATLNELDGLDKAAEHQQLTFQDLERRKILRMKMDQF